MVRARLHGFLAQCGEGGGYSLPTNFGGASPGPLPGSGGTAGADVRRWIDEALRAFNADVLLYVSLGVGAFVLSFGAWVFVLWFSSRAKLMFVESVIWDRVDVGGQWNRAAGLGMSLFKFRVALAAAGVSLIVLSLGAGVALALPDLRAGLLLGTQALIGYAVCTIGLLFFGFPVAVASVLLDDFVVPLMVVRNVRVSEAWYLCRAEVLAGNIGGVVLFYLLRLLLAMGAAMVTMMVTCLTCCITAIPYVGTVVLLLSSSLSRLPALYMQLRGLRSSPCRAVVGAVDQWRFPSERQSATGRARQSLPAVRAVASGAPSPPSPAPAANEQLPRKYESSGMRRRHSREAA